MSRAKEIFQAVCDAPNAAAAIEELPLKDWRKLYTYVLADLTQEGVRGMVAGLVFVDGAARLNAGGDE
jgi:hypothetical protein